MSLSDYMREQRKKKDWSQRDLAAAADVSNAEISRIESGKRKSPNPTVLKAIAKALSVPINEIYEEAGIIDEGQKFFDKCIDKYGDTPISEEVSSSDFSSSPTYLTIDDLSADEIADVKKYIAFIKSQRK